MLVTCQLLLTVTAQASTEVIHYGYDRARQLREVRSDDGTEVNYVYDTSGNRLFKSLDSAANNPPSSLSNISPSDSYANVELTPLLSWTDSTDSDEGDTITYDIYLGTISPPALYKSGHDSTEFNTFPLQPDTRYFWKIVARDTHNNTTEGPIWSFITERVAIPPRADAGGLYYGTEGQPD